ncbi:MAG: outer membrane beta-barrel protein [Rhizobiales bacterium]|nr:outer membrane beta-barrel protein [Hyphomicrobiales bacterium]
MRLTRLGAAVLLLVGSIFGLHAADMRTQPAAAPPAPLWSGLYLGLHAGYASAQASGTTFDGLLGGFQIGYNAQVAGNLILGVEADLSGADISRTDGGTLFGIATSATTRTYALGTARARAGFAFGQFMIYGTGGFAWAVNELKGTLGGLSMSDARTHTGYTVGAGMEWMIAPAWTARAEYLYAHFGSRTYFGGAVASGDVDANIVRFGVNYLFR